MKDNRLTENTHQEKSQIEHIILRPEIYIGSIEIQKDELWVYNTSEEKLEFREVNYVAGLFKIFDEILVSAADNYQSNFKLIFRGHKKHDLHQSLD
jgi:DNA topoisomerase-2